MKTRSSIRKEKEFEQNEKEKRGFDALLNKRNKEECFRQSSGNYSSNVEIRSTKKKEKKSFDKWRHKEAWLLNYALNYGKKNL